VANKLTLQKGVEGLSFANGKKGGISKIFRQEKEGSSGNLLVSAERV